MVFWGRSMVYVSYRDNEKKELGFIELFCVWNVLLFYYRL